MCAAVWRSLVRAAVWRRLVCDRCVTAWCVTGVQKEPRHMREVPHIWLNESWHTWLE